MSAHHREVVYNETLPMEMAAAALDLERLRRGFAELFDRAAQAVQLAGYEQDDAVFERYLVLRTADGADISIGAEWLADRERLIGDIAGVGGDLSRVSIIGVKVKVVFDTGG